MFTPINGMYLATKNGQRFSNAIVVDVADNGNVKIMTDFGNLVTLYSSEVVIHFEPLEVWEEAKTMGYPFPPTPERIQEQIALLEKALHELHQ